MWHVTAAKTSVRRRIVGHQSYPCLSGKTEDEPMNTRTQAGAGNFQGIECEQAKGNAKKTKRKQGRDIVP